MIKIEHIDDILSKIPSDAGITVANNAEYTVINYVRGRFEAFTDPEILECRGLKFAPDGRILARPFHKFFALDARAALRRVDWLKPHRVQERLDGVLIHPCRLGGRLVFMTRVGEQAVSHTAREAADASVIGLCEEALSAGITPLFEYTSANPFGYVTYDRPALTLLAARETVSGRYLTHGELLSLAVSHGVVIVQDLEASRNPEALVFAARNLTDSAGYVVAFDDGTRFSLLSQGFIDFREDGNGANGGGDMCRRSSESDDNVAC